MLPASFDEVTLSDVLKRIPDPVRCTRACGALLPPGGHLFADVPDLDSPLARFLGLRWPLRLSEHLNYLNPKNLRLCGQFAALTWLHFGRRLAYFSIHYVLYRLLQDRVRDASIARSPATLLGLADTVIPVTLGELYGVWRR